ncbi:MAG: ABC transporter substrate-binding protein [Limnochordia bacterium]|jgi:multiple sugar transport system substrate-binding protein
MLKQSPIKTVLAVIVLLTLVISCGAGAFAKTKLTVWDWHQPRVEMAQKAVAEYQKINPNVEFEFMIIPWDDYWKKLLAGAAARQVPDIAMFHNAQHSVFEQLLEPYPESLFPMAEMQENFFGFEAAFVHDGKFYYHPTGLMSSLIFYNKGIFADEGVDPDQIPSNWDEFIALAQKLTKYNAQGEVQRAGFAFNAHGSFMFNDLMYQLGNMTYAEGGKSVDWNNENGIKTAQLLYDMYYKYKINSPGFLVSTEAFGTGHAAMAYAWTWFGGYMDSTYPDVSYGAVMLPTWTGNPEPAVARNNYECGYAVFKAVPQDKKEEAFKFIQWWISEATDELQVTSNLLMGTVPGALRLWSHPGIVGDPVIGTLAKQIPYTIFPGEWPTRLENALTRLEEMLRNQMSPAEVVQAADADAKRALRDKPVDWVAERAWDM